MKSSKSALVTLPKLVQDFFEKHLTMERNASPNTVLAYRDALKLFLRHAAQRMECAVDQLDHAILDVDVVRSFLGWLEKERKCGARVQEIVDLDLCDIRLDPVPVVTIEGKGRKQRTLPLWERTVEVLEQWLANGSRSAATPTGRSCSTPRTSVSAARASPTS